jgi:hypothetical protein
MDARFDFSGVDSLVGDLASAQERAVKVAQTVVVRAAFAIKKDAAQRFTDQRSGEYLPGYARSISYDVENTSSGASAEIGPESSGQGPLGGIIEYGTARSAPLPHLNPALDAEEPKMLDALAAAAAGLIR